MPENRRDANTPKRIALDDVHGMAELFAEAAGAAPRPPLTPVQQAIFDAIPPPLTPPEAILCEPLLDAINRNTQRVLEQSAISRAFGDVLKPYYGVRHQKNAGYYRTTL